MDTAFVISINTKDGNKYYLGQRDGIMTKLHSAVIYHDQMHAQYELNRFLGVKNTFITSEDKLLIQPIQITEI